LWGRSFHGVPKEYVLPSGTIRIAWQCWCAGNPPLRLLTKHEMSSRLQRNRLSELRRMMLLIQNLLTQDEIRRAHSSTDAAGLLFEQVKTHFHLARHLQREECEDWSSYRGGHWRVSLSHNTLVAVLDCSISC
ncbi:hypothetical protein PHMEG_00036630, partial [Phytophthora megakarya]